MNRRDFIKTGVLFPVFLAGTALYLNYLHNKTEKTTFDDDKKIGYIEVSIVDYCNLNCKYCCHLSPLADKIYYPINQYKKDLEKIKELSSDNLEVLQITGGEPLLHPQIIDVLNISRNMFQKTYIYMSTNALLLNSMPESFWHTLKQTDILLYINFYDANIDWQSIKNKIKKYGIKSNLTPKDDVGYIQKFYNMNFDLEGKQTYFRCPQCFTFLVMLQESKLYKCPVISNIKYFNKAFNKNLIITDNDYIDLHKIKNIQEFYEWNSNRPDFCKYCGEPFEMDWITAKEHTIYEWTLKNS